MYFDLDWRTADFCFDACWQGTQVTVLQLFLRYSVEIYKCSQWNASTHIQQAHDLVAASKEHTHAWYTQMSQMPVHTAWQSSQKSFKISGQDYSHLLQPCRGKFTAFTYFRLSNNRKSTMTLILALSTVQLSKLCGNLVTEDQCWNYLAIHVAPLTVSQKIWEWKPIWLKWKWCSSSSFFDEIATRASSISQKEKHKVGSQL